ncbi:nuclease-related domain-containing protein [Desertibacillus haloalkaliphilus]|uniref:nuclease-related domain-containing protein n=1 Tax=Desertibacillus haloalkaliphilus TaxID=1328930 RepID=UPI001C27CEE2|nr:nuclease-related domain-containing protein [Desertibacillus haloalkaliphilus]MBU8906531.1 NERD domain-containing protein [Desertibacillus haloalkaliphilus]
MSFSLLVGITIIVTFDGDFIHIEKDGYGTRSIVGEMFARKRSFKNPQHQSFYHAKHLRNYLVSQGYQQQVKPVVILTTPSGKWMGRQDDDCPILRVNEFINYVNKRPAVDNWVPGTLSGVPGTGFHAPY